MLWIYWGFFSLKKLRLWKSNIISCTYYDVINWRSYCQSILLAKLPERNKKWLIHFQVLAFESSYHYTIKSWKIQIIIKQSEGKRKEHKLKSQTKPGVIQAGQTWLCKFQHLPSLSGSWFPICKPGIMWPSQHHGQRSQLKIAQQLTYSSSFLLLH